MYISSDLAPNLSPSQATERTISHLAYLFLFSEELPPIPFLWSRVRIVVLLLLEFSILTGTLTAATGPPIRSLKFCREVPLFLRHDTPLQQKIIRTGFVMARPAGGTVCQYCGRI